VPWLDRDPVTAGDDPPEIPEGAPGIVRRFLPDDAEENRCYVVRVRLDSPSDRYARELLDELRTETEVYGSMYDLESGPDEPGCFDVVLSREYRLPRIVRALARPGNVEAVTGVPVPVEPVDGAAADAAEAENADGSDVTAALGAIESEDRDVAETDWDTPETGAFADGDSDASADAGAGAGNASDSVGEPEATEAATSDGPTSERDPASGTGVAESERGEDGDGGGAHHPTFEELEGEVDQLAYDDIVEELESTELPGEFDADADLSSVIGDDGTVDAEMDGPAAAGDGAVGDVDGPAVGRGDGPRDDHGDQLSPDAVVDALVTALEADALTAEQRRTIAGALEGRPPKTMQVKLDHLQREIDELTAYKDSLETFIDEYGSGEDLVEEVREPIEAFAADVQQIGATVQALKNDLERTRGLLAEHDDRLQRTDGRLSDVSEQLAELDGVDARVEENRARIADVREVATRVDDNAARVADLADIQRRLDDLDEVEDTLRALTAEVEALEDAVGEPPDAEGEVVEGLEGVEDRLAELGARVSAVESETSERLSRLSDRLDTVEQRLDRQEAWRDRFQSLLVGSLADDGDDSLE